jgi:hypothetical protein
MNAVAMPVSFDRDVRTLFRQIDIDHMSPYGVLLADYSYMSLPDNNHANAQDVLDFLSGKKQPQMPIGGPFWDSTKLSLYQRWMDDGYKP